MPRNLTCGNVKAKEVLITWKKPEFIYGLSGIFEVKYEYWVNGEWVRKKPLRSKQREFTLETRPFTKYRVSVRESVGSKWGNYSRQCTFTTKEGGLSLHYTIVIFCMWIIAELKNRDGGCFTAPRNIEEHFSRPHGTS